MGKIRRTDGARGGAAEESSSRGSTSKAGPAASANQSAEERTPARQPFTVVEVHTKPGAVSQVLAGVKESEVTAEVLRPRLMTESVEHGRGRGVIRHFSFRKFRDEKARAVLFVTMPRGLGGGSFEPTDRLLKPGEQVQVSYTSFVEAAGRPIYLMGKGAFLRKSLYVSESPDDPDKPWIGSRAEAADKLPKNLLVSGEDVIELRMDSITSFPNGPGALRRNVLDQYIDQVRLIIVPNGAVWNQKSGQGNFFESIRDPLDKLLEREGTKIISRVGHSEFGNLGDVFLLIKERLLSGIDHEVARPGVVKKPNEHLREINNQLGFLLHFRISDEIKERLMRTFPQKAGKEEDVFLPLTLERVTEGRQQYRLQFRVFPRDLVEERSRKTMDRGLRFMPPYALHPGPENHNTYSKLLIALSQCFREDEKPEEEKVKSAKLRASVEKRIAERRHEFVDEKVRAAFSERISARKRKEEEG